VNEQYVLTPDGAAVLRVAAENWDRAQQAREQVTREGLTVEGHRNPACDIERQAYSLFLRAMRQLGLDIVPPGGKLGRPGGS
jgi:phage terminase small subunit